MREGLFRFDGRGGRSRLSLAARIFPGTSKHVMPGLDPDIHGFVFCERAAESLAGKRKN
jgi:hypothetical protein